MVLLQNARHQRKLPREHGKNMRECSCLDSPMLLEQPTDGLLN